MTLLAGALVVSLAVNLFVVGALAGRFSFHDREAGRGGMFTRFQALPRAERVQFRLAMQPQGAQLRAAQQALRAAQVATLEALQATPYDPVRMRQAFAALGAATAARQTALHAALVPALATLPPEARASLATGSGLTQP